MSVYKIHSSGFKKPQTLKDIMCFKLPVDSPVGYTIIDVLLKQYNYYIGGGDYFYFSTDNENHTYEVLLQEYLKTTHNFPMIDFLTGGDNVVLDIASNIFVNYGNRKLNESMYDYIIHWDGSHDDYVSILDSVLASFILVYKNNAYKWVNLFKSSLLEFNPLWNVDGVDEIVRTLERDGTESRAKTGTETDAKTGTETNMKTGTERDAKTGTETTTRTGTETTGYNGRELNTLSGSDSSTQTGTIMHGTQKTTTESNTFLDTEKVTDTFNTPTTTLYGKSETKSFTDRSDTLTLNTTDTLTHNTTNTLTHGTTDTLTHATTDTLTHNTNDVLTLDTVDTERTRHERHGNIGVTTTTKLLEEFRQYADFNLLDLISKEFVNAVTEGVY